MSSENVNKMKDPQSIITFGFRWGEYLGKDKTIHSHTLIVNEGEISEDDLVISNDYHTDTDVIFLASGGKLGKTYKVLCRVTFGKNGIEQDERTMRIRIVNR